MLNKTIFIITNQDKAILRSFSTKKRALEVLENEYKKLMEDVFIEPVALEFNKDFIVEALKDFIRDLRSQLFNKEMDGKDCQKEIKDLKEILKI